MLFRKRLVFCITLLFVCVYMVDNLWHTCRLDTHHNYTKDTLLPGSFEVTAMRVTMHTETFIFY